MVIYIIYLKRFKLPTALYALYFRYLKENGKETCSVTEVLINIKYLIDKCGVVYRYFCS